MIEIINISNDRPYKIFKNFYDSALQAKQKSIEAISIASFNLNSNEVESRFVNLKYINEFFWRENILEDFSTTNSTTQTFSPKPNTLLLFPPWIDHKVEINKTDEERISIAFNTMLQNV